MSKSPYPEKNISGTADEPKASAKPQRSKAELLLVRGGIAVLLIVSGIEFYAQRTFQKIHDELQLQLEKADAGNTQITRAQVDAVMGKRVPNETKNVKVANGEERYDLYIFSGLLKERLICVRYGVAGVEKEPDVIEITAIRPDAML